MYYVLPLITNPLVSKTLFYLMIKNDTVSNELGQIVVLVSLVITCHGDQRREVSVTQFLPSLLYTHCTVALHCTLLS